MRITQDKTGTFSERPYYKEKEIEQICSQELQRVGLYPKSPEPVRIERFIEKRFRITPSYEYDLPKATIGFTEFGPEGPIRVVISGTLVEQDDEVSFRRVSTTLAHEAGHCLLHSYLFPLSKGSASLFSEEMSREPSKILCRGNTIDGMAQRSKRYTGKWWEFQANLAMAALLLPRPLVIQNVKPFVASVGLLQVEGLPKDRREKAVRQVAEAFGVNPIVARIRLSGIYPEDSGQLTL